MSRHHSIFIGNMDENEGVTSLGSYDSGEDVKERIVVPNSLIFKTSLDANENDNSNAINSSAPETRSTAYDSDQDKESPPNVNPLEIENGGTNSSFFSGISSNIRKIHQNVFQNKYSKKEGFFVFFTAAFLAFNIGFANGATMSGFLTSSGNSTNIAGMGGSFTNSALTLVDGDTRSFAFYSNIILSYMLGNLCVGLIAPDPIPWNMQPAYGPTFLIGGAFAFIAAILSSLQYEERFIYFFASAATGVQNGIASSYSANLLRCAITGSSTDLALCIGHVIRGNLKDVWRIYVLSTICFTFWFGGIVAYYAARRFRSQTLFINACLFLIMGVGLILFLVEELGISAHAAVLGTWQWRDTMEKISASKFGTQFSEVEFRNLFDEIDIDGSGTITTEELLDFLLQSKINISGKGVKILIKCADENGDGHIDREEWGRICTKFFRKTSA